MFFRDSNDDLKSYREHNFWKGDHIATKSKPLDIKFQRLSSKILYDIFIPSKIPPSNPYKIKEWKGSGTSHGRKNYGMYNIYSKCVHFFKYMPQTISKFECCV